MRRGEEHGTANVNSDGAGIGGGIGVGPDGYDGHVTFYVEVPDVEAALAGRDPRRVTLFGPEVVTEGVELGHFADPEGHLVGLVKSVS